MDSASQMYVKPARAAELLDVSLAQVYRLMDRGMPNVKIGKSRRIDVEAMRQWIADQDLRPVIAYPTQVSSNETKKTVSGKLTVSEVR